VLLESSTASTVETGREFVQRGCILCCFADAWSAQTGRASASILTLRFGVVDLVAAGALPRDYLLSVKETLAARHIGERRLRELAGNRLIAPAGHGEPIQFQPGLTDAECNELDERLGLRFPPDLRSFLQFTLPIQGHRFPNWRDNAAEELASSFENLLHGICFDIVNADFWYPAWGTKPTSDEAACAIPEAALKAAPRFIRIFGHRYIPDTPVEAGNPVFSIVQTDIIWYGFDLADYFSKEFGVPRPEWAATEARSIEFWTELHRLSNFA
jgi:hypothetical protein